ncbi:MAG: hypothetical protein WC732_08740 [Candidatus Omnitrophota bacterium]
MERKIREEGSPHEATPFFDTLDDYVVEHIASLLVDGDSLRHLQRVRMASRRLRAAANSATVWMHIDVGRAIVDACPGMRHIETDDPCVVRLSHAPDIFRHADLSMCTTFDASYLPTTVWLPLVRRMPHLRLLVVHLGVDAVDESGRRNEYTDTIGAVGEFNRELETLHVHMRLALFDTRTIVPLPSVRTLRVRVTGPVVDALSLGCQGLRVAKIDSPLGFAQPADAAARLLLRHERTLVKFKSYALSASVLAAQTPDSRREWPNMRELGVGVFTGETMACLRTVFTWGLGNLETLGVTLSADDAPHDAAIMRRELAERPGLWLRVALRGVGERAYNPMLGLDTTIGPRIRRLRLDSVPNLPSAHDIHLGFANLRVLTLHRATTRSVAVLSNTLLRGVPPPGSGTVVTRRGSVLDIVCTPGIPGPLVRRPDVPARTRESHVWEELIRCMHLWGKQPQWSNKIRVTFV